MASVSGGDFPLNTEWNPQAPKGEGHFIPHEVDAKLKKLAKALDNWKMDDARKLNEEIFQDVHVYPVSEAALEGHLKQPAFPKGKTLNGVRAVVLQALSHEGIHKGAAKTDPLALLPESFEQLAEAGKLIKYAQSGDPLHQALVKYAKALKFLWKEVASIFQQLRREIFGEGGSSQKALQAQYEEMFGLIDNLQRFIANPKCEFYLEEYPKLPEEIETFENQFRTAFDRDFANLNQASPTARKELAKSLALFGQSLYTRMAHVVIEYARHQVNSEMAAQHYLKSILIPEERNQLVHLINKANDFDAFLADFERRFDEANRKGDLKALKRLAHQFPQEAVKRAAEINVQLT